MQPFCCYGGDNKKGTGSISVFATVFHLPLWVGPLFGSHNTAKMKGFPAQRASLDFTVSHLSICKRGARCWRGASELFGPGASCILALGRPARWQPPCRPRPASRSRKGRIEIFSHIEVLALARRVGAARATFWPGRVVHTCPGSPSPLAATVPTEAGLPGSSRGAKRAILVFQHLNVKLYRVVLVRRVLAVLRAPVRCCTGELLRQATEANRSVLPPFSHLCNFAGVGHARASREPEALCECARTVHRRAARRRGKHCRPQRRQPWRPAAEARVPDTRACAGSRALRVLD